MKRVGYLFEKITSKENITEAIHEASKNKKNRKEVKDVYKHLDFYISKIQQMLMNKQFENSTPVIRYRYEKMQNKMRELTILPFYPDQIVHHAVIRVIVPYLKRGMYEYCCANIPGRGEKHIRIHLSKSLKSDYKGTKYCLKFDIKKFYASISKCKLFEKLKRIIKDNDTLSILKTIINLQHSGLPLGSYSSQWLANFYLQDMDHFIKEKLNAKYMYRYADDIVILDSNKRKLHKMMQAIKEFAASDSLTIKDNWRIFKVDDTNAIDFVGYKFYRRKISIRKKIFKNIRHLMIRMLRKIKLYKRISVKEIRSLMSYLGYIKNSDSYVIRHKYLHLLPIKQLKISL